MNEYINARDDLANIIAQQTSGFVGAIPEQDDFDLADVFIKMIEERN